MEHDSDDEHTSEEEEALSGDSCSNELDDFQKESERLLAIYGYGGSAEQNEPQDTRSSSEEEIPSNQDLTLDKDEIARDLLKNSDDDDDDKETSLYDSLNSVPTSQTVRLLRSNSQPGSEEEYESDEEDNDFVPVVADDDFKKALLQAHDVVGPEVYGEDAVGVTPPPLQPYLNGDSQSETPDTEMEPHNVTVKLAQFHKNTEGPMGIRLKVNKQGRCKVARIKHGGMIHREGTLHVGDEIRAINYVSVMGKSVQSLHRMLKYARGYVSLTIVSSHRNNPAHCKRSHFANGGSSDSVLPYDNLPSSQRGLFDQYHNFGIFVTIKKGTVKVQYCDRILKSFKEVLKTAMSMTDRTRIHIAFAPKLWRTWRPESRVEDRPIGQYLLKTTTKFVNTDGDIFFYIKSDVKPNSDKVLDLLKQELRTVPVGTDDLDITPSNEYGNKGIIYGSFREGLGNFANRTAVDQNILIGESDTGGIGGTYMLTQKFQACWEILERKSQPAKEEMIGRKMFDMGTIPVMNANCHIKLARKMDDFPPPCNVNKNRRKIFRQSMPYGTYKNQPGKEEGAFFVAYAKSLNVFKDILKNLAGHPGTNYDLFLENFSAIEGSFWYVPSLHELKIVPDGLCKVDLDPQWAIPRRNKYIFYNHRQYLHEMERTLENASTKKDDFLSQRVLKILQYTFEQWENGWFRKIDSPEIPCLEEMLQDKEKHIIQASIPVRKAMAIKKSLGELFTTAEIESKMSDQSSFYGWKADLFNIHPSEIIVGRMPKVSTLGLGKKVMHYLNEDERMSCFLLGLSESSAIGHVIPDHKKLLNLGVQGLIDDINVRRRNYGVPETEEFYQSCITALEGVKMYIANFGRLAKYMLGLEKEYTSKERENLQMIAKRMDHLSKGKPNTFTDAVQLIFAMHCCLHLIGQPVSVGRIDELLAPFFKDGDMTNDSYQEVIDCFWIKFGERVILDPHHATDDTSWGNCAVPYSSDGNFPRGDSLNQWVQQVTVGGYHNTNDSVLVDAMNKVAKLCLKAARRLPLNAPCLSLRLHRKIGNDLLEEASKALLSGGAHPILLHDDRIIEALKNSAHLQDSPINVADVKNYACDGCYEPLIVGKSEFTFTYIPLPKILELAINRGDTYVSAGPAYLQGTPSSYRTPVASTISSFDELKKYFKVHLDVQIKAGMYKLLMNYGNIWKACPAPLLSTLIDGCLATGRDLYNGGATYLIAACMFIGFSNCVDSLYSIKKLCFDNTTACVSLKELVFALKNDWGFQMEEPFLDTNAGFMRTAEKSDHYHSLRKRVLDFPKFGTDEGQDDGTIKDIAKWLAETVISTFNAIVQNRTTDNPLQKLLESIKSKYSTPESPFECIFCPGSGTFEGYVGWGMSLGASADGRRKAMPIASDFSAAPVIQDGPVKPSQNDIYKSMQNWDIDCIKNGFSNGAEIDLNIHEDFPEDELKDFLRKFADGKSIGGNIITVTCANEDSYENACQNSEKYDLLRVRMGGWSEHFIAMFNAHKKQHMRRAYYLPPSKVKANRKMENNN